jgi:hypothetical protein
MRWARHVASIGEMRNAYKIVVEKPEGKRSLRISRHRWEDITMDLREIRLEVVDWIHLAQDRDQWRALPHTVINLLVA